MKQRSRSCEGRLEATATNTVTHAYVDGGANDVTYPFTNFITEDTSVTNCAYTCSISTTSPYVSVSATAPYDLTAHNAVAGGYSLTFDYKCLYNNRIAEQNDIPRSAFKK